MSELRTVAVVGAGLAGAKTVEALRAEGFDGRIVLFGEESHRPYERPPLSKGYLQGNDERETVFVHPEGWYAEHDVDLRLGVPVTGLDRHARELMTRDGDAVHYDRLVLATGATPRRLPPAGWGQAGGALPPLRRRQRRAARRVPSRGERGGGRGGMDRSRDRGRRTRAPAPP